ncbi:energy transducer TonB, partial [Acinetobacter schindleri]
MKNIIILTSILFLSGCKINYKFLSPAKSDDEKIIVEAEKYKQQYQKKIFKIWNVPPSSVGMSASVKVF